MGADDFGGDGQAEAEMVVFSFVLTGSGFIGAVKPLENFFFLLVRHADSGVLHPYFKSTFFGMMVQAEMNLSVGGRVADGVVQQDFQKLYDPVPVTGECRNGLFGQADLKADVFSAATGRKAS